MLDEKDLKILEILKENSRAPYSRIAREIGITDAAVIKRIRKMEKIGAIRKYTISIDPKKLGYSSISITGADVEPESLFKVINRLKEMPNVKYLAMASGDHSLMMVIWAKDNSEMEKLHQEIAKIEGIKRICPAIILEVLKDELPWRGGLRIGEVS